MKLNEMERNGMKWNEIIEASGKNKTKPKIKTKR